MVVWSAPRRFGAEIRKFELTGYLRKLNKTKSQPLACAEPIDPLPSEAELKTKFDELDHQLNKRYSEILQKGDKGQVTNLREAQRTWIKHRDEGAKFYISPVPGSGERAASAPISLRCHSSKNRHAARRMGALTLSMKTWKPELIFVHWQLLMCLV